MSTLMFAINWEPELRGWLTVILGVIVWPGSIYLILSTNLGARLGFLVAAAGLAGWMALMGGIWWIYGIGYMGEAASWKAVEGSTVIQQVDLLDEAGVLDQPIAATSTDDPSIASEEVAVQLSDQDWVALDAAEPAFGQAVASAGTFLEEEGAFEAGDYAVTAVYEVNPPEESAYPAFGPNNEFDQLAFFHPPYYTLVEVAPYLPVRTEAGRAPTAPLVDETAPRQYVYMIRDLGSLREPAANLTIGASIVFLGLCYLLHRRDKIVAVNLQRKAVAAA